jgi:hypothetical protein
MSKRRVLVWIVLSFMLLATGARADDEPPLHPPPLPPPPPSRWTLQKRAERHIISGKALTAIGIAHGVLAVGLGLGFALGSPTFEGDKPWRDFVAVPVGGILGGSAAVLLAIGIPLWVTGARARHQTIATVRVGPSALSLTL